MSILFVILNTLIKSTLSFSAVWSGSALFAICSSLIRVKVHCHLRNSLIRVYTICHSQLSDHGLHYFAFFLSSFIKVYTVSAVWSGSTIFVILSSLIRVYTVCILSSLIKIYTICHPQSDQGLHYLPFSAVWTGSTLFAILSKQYYQSLTFSALWFWSTLFAVLSSLFRVYTACHFRQSDQGLDYLRISAVWSRWRSTMSFSGTVWSKSTLFAILSSLIKVYTVCHSQQTDQGIHSCHSQQSDQGLHYLLFSEVWSGSTLFAILSKQSDQGLHRLPFSAIRSGSTLFAILSSLIKVFTICHSQQSDQGLQYLPFFLSSIIEVCTVCHSL